MRALIWAAACLAAIVAVATTRSSDAAFTTQRSNPNNTFAAASSFERMRISSGTYAGNAADNRNIAVPFQPDLVIVKGNTAQTAVAKTSTMAGDSSKPLGGAVANTTNMIQALQASGFQVGTNARVNSTGVNYSWVALTKAQGTMSVGSYTGNGAASRSLTGLGYSPETAMVLGANASAPVLRIAGMSAGFAFDGGTGVASSVASLDADGFTVGSSSSTNTNGQAYHYVTWNETVGLADAGSYTGNGAAGRSIAGVGFAPSLALVRSSSTTTSRAGVWRPSAVTGTTSLRFNAATDDSAAITGLQADGFQVGTSTDANANTNPYAFLALRDEAPH